MTQDIRGIYITGCAKTGTTLLRRMFWALRYPTPTMIVEEINPRHFVERLPDEEGIVLVGKRDIYSPGAGEYEDPLGIQTLVDHNVGIIWCTRNERDVLKSGVSKSRFIRSHKEYAKWSTSASIPLCRYEELVTDPDEEMDYFADRFGLEFATRWSNYPEFVPEVDGVIFRDHPSYALRPLSTDRINK